MTMTFGRSRVAGACLLPVLLTAASLSTTGAARADSGITNTEVTIGMSAAMSGPNAGYGAIGRSMQACVSYLNEEAGGVTFGDGVKRKVKLELLDDAMEPARALQNARRFASQLKVFAVVGNAGTGANLGTRTYYNSEKLPQMFIGSGGPMFGDKKEVASYPWTMPAWLAYNTEAAMYAAFIKEKFPNAKIALLNDDSGGPFFSEAFLKSAKELGLNIVAHEEHTYSEPTINAKISRLADSGADVFVDATTPKFVVQAIKQAASIGWKPKHIIWGVGSSIGGVFEPAGIENSKGVYSGQWLKDQSNPAYANDEDVKLYVAKLKQYGSSLNPADQNAAAGWFVCFATKYLFEQMKQPTRQAFMDAARNMKNVKFPLLLDGINLNTNGAEDGYPIEAVQISQFDGVKFVPVGGVINYENKTPPYEPKSR
ncbi:ABC transporter substrate-binding protein [Tardiphaga sp.]|jgi:branched-chain amino acid transport system substrate-binding protein|uniref:ABC transporter substrate-binding protein n=1 Tax=Tardiphaga sp. TaxID=1926292 RepID=UPI0037D9BA0E